MGLKSLDRILMINRIGLLMGFSNLYKDKHLLQGDNHMESKENFYLSVD